MGRTARVTREQVLAAARETFVERGYEGATLANIGGRLSISPAALLRHAPTKRALFLAAMGEGAPAGDMLPLAFLEKCDGTEDPRQILRRVAETMVPFLESRIREIVARWVYFKTLPGVGRVPLPFDPAARPTPPQRNLGFLESYMRRAVKKGRLRLANPRAAAFAFFATVHSFVFLQHVVEALEEPMPLDEYLDSVLEVWTRGAVPSAPRGRQR
jgi:TetR/AcrR family transcriptional regulator, mexJK operon transcriptional repressor